MKTIRRIAISIIVALGLAAPAFVPTLVSAAADGGPSIKQGLCNGANLSFSGEDQACLDDDTGAASEVDGIITTVIDIFSLVVGIVSVIMIIYGGFRYITSGGESGGITTAKNTILYAIVGLVIVALAQLIVRFVLGKVATTTEV